MTALPVLYADRIIQDRNIVHGKPVINGTRIPVQVVLEYLAQNPNFDDLFADYPRLTMADVQACLDYAQRLVPDHGTHDVGLDDRSCLGG